VHARGSVAHGFFECYASLTEHTKAAPFKEAGKITPTFVRFSTVAGERGSKDTARDVKSSTAVEHEPASQPRGRNSIVGGVQRCPAFAPSLRSATMTQNESP
jgi:Catalase